MGRAKVIPAKTLLLPYQKRWVEDRSRLKLAVKARQIGWSWASAYSIVRRKALATARLDAWITSRDELQAKLFVDDCKAFANILQTGAEDLGERVLRDPEGKAGSAFVLRMANGASVYSLSSNPNAQAGKRGDRIIDEAALHADLRFLYSIAYPGITWGGQLEIFSTPRGETHFFQTLVKDIELNGNPKKFSFHKVTLRDALDEGFLYKLQEKLPADDERQEMDEDEYFEFIRGGCADEETFQQEYMCVPSSDSDTFIGYDLIDGCRVRGTGTTGPAKKQEKNAPWVKVWRSADPIGNGPLYLGMDVGRKKDLTCFWLAEDVAGRLVPREVKVMHKQRFAVQEEALDEYALMENFMRGCVDAGGIGAQLAERARERHGYKIEPVTFTAPLKEKMAYAVRAGMEDSTFLTPDEQFVVVDFRKIKKVVTASNNIRFDGDRDEDGHSDRFWGAALCREAKGSGGEYVPPIVAPPLPDYDQRSPY